MRKILFGCMALALSAQCLAQPIPQGQVGQRVPQYRFDNLSASFQTVLGINPTGYVFGVDHSSRGITWKNRAVELLPIEDGELPADINAARDILVDDLVSGRFIGRDGTEFVIPLLAGASQQFPASLADTPQGADFIGVGFGIFPNSTRPNRALLFVDTSVIDLTPYVVPAGQTIDLTRATKVNNQGVILAQGRVNGAQKDLLITPGDAGFEYEAFDNWALRDINDSGVLLLDLFDSGSSQSTSHLRYSDGRLVPVLNAENGPVWLHFLSNRNVATGYTCTMRDGCYAVLYNGMTDRVVNLNDLVPSGTPHLNSAEMISADTDEIVVHFGDNYCDGLPGPCYGLLSPTRVSMRRIVP